MNNNPLRQYFRRPAVHIKLPSGGKGYGPDVIEIPESGELTVFPMTAIDEITVKTPDALFNGSAITDLIKSCVPAIKDPWSITSTDLDSVLIAIKAASGSSDMELDSQCPSCKETSTYSINLINILASMRAGDYDKELVLGDLTFKFRPLTFKEMNEASIRQLEVQKIFVNLDKEPDTDVKLKKSQDALKVITELTMIILAKTIVYIKTPTTLVDNPEYVLDFLKNCDKTIYLRIRDYNSELKSQTEIKPLDIKCASCEHLYNQPFTLNASDFFV